MSVVLVDPAAYSFLEAMGERLDVVFPVLEESPIRLSTRTALILARRNARIASRDA
jgi:hypothetical protein